MTVTVRLPDGSTNQYEKPVSPADVARMAGTMARILDVAAAVAAALAESETTR